MDASILQARAATLKKTNSKFSSPATETRQPGVASAVDPQVQGMSSTHAAGPPPLTRPKPKKKSVHQPHTIEQQPYNDHGAGSGHSLPRRLSDARSKIQGVNGPPAVPIRAAHPSPVQTVHQPAPVHQPPVHQPPVHQPPVHQPPVHQPPVHQPPVHQPPVHQPPVHQPPVHQPPVHQPPVHQPPVHQPPVHQPPVHQPPVHQPPVHQPPVHQPPVHQPPVHQPPVHQPPVHQPPVHQPPVHQPPVHQPPVHQPPVHQPPVHQPPVHQPPVHQPPVHQPPVHQPPVHQPPVHQPPVHQPPFHQPPMQVVQTDQMYRRNTAPGKQTRPPLPTRANPPEQINHQQLQHQPSSFIDDFPDDAYDDIESVKEEMALHLMKMNQSLPQPSPAQPPPAQPPPPSPLPPQPPASQEPVPPPLPPPNIARKNIPPNINNPIELSGNVSLYEKRRNSAADSSMRKKNPLLLKRAPINEASQPNPSAIPGTPDKKSSSTPLTLQQLVDKHQNEFPLQVKVFQKGQVKNKTSINKGDTFNIHFITSTKMAQLTSANKEQYYVPFNSALEFGVVYDPVKHADEAKQGYLFNTVKELMNAPGLPSVVYAQKSYDSSSYEGSIQAGEILIVKQIQKALMRGKYLSCAVVGSNQKKKLLENCEGSFSTTPSDVKMPLSYLLNEVPLPVSCMLYYSGLNSQAISGQLPHDVVTVNSLEDRRSLVVSKLHSNQLFELFLDNDCLFEIVQMSPGEVETLKKTSFEYYRSFHPESIDSTSLLMSSNSLHLQKQVAIMSPVHYNEGTLEEIYIKLPPMLKSSGVISPTPSDKSNEDMYQYPDEAVANYQAQLQGKEPSSDIELVYDVPQSSESAGNAGNDIYDVPRKQSQQLHGGTHAATDMNVEALQSVVKCLIQTIEQMKQEIMILQQQVDPSKLPKPTNTPESNRMFLYTLSISQVQHLLKEMNLSEYAQAFSQKSIDGAVMSRMDEAMLDELGITSRLHKKRIIGVVEGRASIRSHFEKDPYVKCFKK